MPEPTSPRIVRSADPEAVAEAAANQFIDAARRAIRRRGRFAVALAGGSTPRALYELVARDPRRGRIDWGRVLFFWGDERAVPKNDRDSNYGMAKAALLDTVTHKREQVFPMPVAEFNLAKAATAYHKTLAKTFGCDPKGEPPVLDLVLLGLGTDGHTASLFPGTRAAAERRLWVAPSQAPVAPFERLTMTVPLINAATQVAFLVTGEGKAEILAAVLEGEPGRYPAQAIAPSNGTLTWHVDEAAAAKLLRK